MEPAEEAVAVLSEVQPLEACSRRAALASQHPQCLLTAAPGSSVPAFCLQELLFSHRKAAHWRLLAAAAKSREEAARMGLLRLGLQVAVW